MTMAPDDLQSVVRVDTLPAPVERPVDAHKGSFGRVLIVAGSRQMSGAASLAGMGALRGGAGLVFLAVPHSIADTVARAEPSYQVTGLPETADGHLDAAAVERLIPLAENCSAVGLGPGLGQSPGVTTVVRGLLDSLPNPVVIDADALNALAADHRQPLCGDQAAGQPPRLLSPHPGEFARLSGLSTAQIQSNREGLAVSFARQHNVTILLKGYQSVVSDGRRLFVNSTGNDGLATGGSGDVLTGLLAALLAQGQDAFEAARLGAYLHGLAGDLAAEDLSRPGLIASDLPHYLALAWNQLPSPT